jgi:hypothetical protein
MNYDFNAYFQGVLDDVIRFRDSDAFPEIEEKNKDHLEMYIFTGAEYLSWIALDYGSEGMTWYSRSLAARKTPQQYQPLMETYAGTETELTELMQQLHSDDRFTDLLEEDLYAMYCLVVSMKISEQLWKRFLTGREWKEYKASTLIDHVYTCIGTQFKNTAQAYDFEFTGNKIHDTAMTLCHYYLGDFFRNQIQKQYASMQQ